LDTPALIGRRVASRPAVVGSADLVASDRGLPDHTEIPGASRQSNKHMGAFEGDRRAEPSKQWRAAAQQNRDHVHADLIDQAERECLLQMVRRADELVARRALGLLNRADDAVGDEGLHGWVPRGRLVVGDNEARVSPTGPLSPQPPSPSFLSNPLRPITMAPTPASISCRMARSSSVAASNIQSCSIPAPSPNGFSRLSFGPVTYPSSEVELSKITSVRSASSLCCSTGRSKQFSFTQTTPGGTSHRPATRSSLGCRSCARLPRRTISGTTVSCPASSCLPPASVFDMSDTKSR
jgi:hypothetical protein